MARSWQTWLRWLGLGSLILTAVIVVIAVVAYAVVRVAGEREIASREALDLVLPDATAYTPAADGRIAPERLAAFLSVRRILNDHCGEFTDIATAFARMDSYAATADAPAGAAPDAGAFARDVGRALQAFGRVARGMSAYLDLRNRALLAADMGLGEFTWLQAIIYYAWLGEPVQRFALARPEEPRLFQDRVVPQLREMIRRHVEAAASAGATDDGPRALAQGTRGAR